jgi:2'-5' RNA ligase
VPFCLHYFYAKISLMLHRIFIAVNLPKNIKEELCRYQNKWPELPVKWVKKENLHITLIFIGYCKEEEILEISNIIRNTAKRYSSFLVNLKRICYGPPGKLPPRMIWAEGEKSKELALLKSSLEKALANSAKTKYSLENRAFFPHITLGRIRSWQWRQIEPEERPEVAEEISLSFEVDSIELMESFLKPRGPEYAVLESCPFGQKDL